MEINFNTYIVLISYYSNVTTLNILKEHHIAFKNLNIIDEYNIEIEINKKDYNTLTSLFKNIKILKKRGILPFIQKQLFKNITLISLFFSCLLFYFCSTLLMKIEINGTSKEINNEIVNFFNENNIKTYLKKPSFDKINKVKEEFYLNNLDTIESIDVTINGNVLYISYNLKKKPIELEKKHGKMYASKDALIDKISISSGNVLVKEYEYVKRGQLIVDDCFYNNNQPIYVGTRGQIYAYTYENVYVSTFYEGHKDDVYIFLLDEARREVSLKFNDEERIEKEYITSFYKVDNYVYLNISYTLYENIITF